MSVSGVGAIGGVNSGTSVYALLSPYLNGVVRTSDAATIARVDATAQTTSPAVAQAAIAANGDAAAAATASPPFANPAITAIGERLALGEALGSTIGVTPDALLNSTGLSGSPNTNALNSVTNLNTLASFDALDTTNSVASFENLTALNSIATLNASASTTANAALQAPVPAATAQDQLTANTNILTGDSGLLVQSYGAVALLAGVQANASVFAQTPTPPLVTAPATVAPLPSVSAVA